MSSAVAEKKPGNKRNSAKSKPSPWLVVFGAIAIIGLMFFISNPIDPNAIK